MSSRYVLNADHSIAPMPDLVEWAARARSDNWIVGDDRVGTSQITTTFTGINMRMRWPDGTLVSPGKPPLLFETTGRDDKGYFFGISRASTYGEARAQHATMVERARDAAERQDASSSGPSSPESSPSVSG